MGNNKKGFTLIELLVVISIIALLLSIMVPGLSKAKDKARLVLCKSNMKQQGLAFSMYIQENKQYFPTAFLAGTEGATDEGTKDGNAMYTYVIWGGKMGTLFTGDVYGKRLINSYMGIQGEASVERMEAATKVFVCPSDKGAWGGAMAGGDMSKGRGPYYWEIVGRSYQYNAAGNSNKAAQGLWGKKNSSVRNPSSLIMVADIPGVAYGADCDPFFYAYWHNKTENGWANILFTDMHVDFHHITNKNPANGQREPGYNYQEGPGWTFIYNK